jgi:hypothetical protein
MVNRLNILFYMWIWLGPNGIGNIHVAIRNKAPYGGGVNAIGAKATTTAIQNQIKTYSL